MEETKKISQESAGIPAGESALKTVRTYRSDAMEAIKGRGQTLTDMVLAEQTKRQSEEIIEKKQLNWNIVFIGGSVALVLAAGLFLFFSFSKTADEKSPAARTVSEIIFAEKQENILLSRISDAEVRNAVVTAVETTRMPTNGIKRIAFTKKVLAENEDGVREEEVPVTSIELLGIPGKNTPQTLLRSLDTSSFFFGLHSFAGNEPFLILKVRSYDNAFRGTLEWEKTMSADLSHLFTVGGLTEKTTGRVFHDVIIKNRDTRLIDGSDGVPALLYSFVDRETIVIATNETTFDEILKRFFAPREIRQ